IAAADVPFIGGDEFVDLAHHGFGFDSRGDHDLVVVDQRRAGVAYCTCAQRAHASQDAKPANHHWLPAPEDVEFIDIRPSSAGAPRTCAPYPSGYSPTTARRWQSRLVVRF